MAASSHGSGSTSSVPSAERRQAQRDRLLAVLRERGPRGITGAELLTIAGTGGRSRLTELRRSGCWIESRRNPHGPWLYILVMQPATPRPQRARRRRVPPPQLSLFSSSPAEARA